MPVAAAEVAGKLVGSDDFKAQIKDIVDARHCVRHPLVEAWAAGKLTRPQMAAWVREHYHFTKDLWAFLAAVYSNCPYPDARAAIMDNLSEEQDPNDPEWAAVVARAYNRFVAERYLKVDGRIQAVALLPLIEPQAAAEELRHAVTELGLVGGLLPAAGLRRPYGDRAFDPLFEAAQSLDVPLAVHGAPRKDVGIDFIDDPDAAFVLAHPYSVMTQFTSMIFERVWDRFPRLKVAFLEAGCGWVPYLMERIDRRTEDRTGRRLATEQVRNSPIYFHAELEERDVLPLALSVVGEDRFVYASDFPHESEATVQRALQGFLARQDVGEGAKRVMTFSLMDQISLWPRSRALCFTLRMMISSSVSYTV